MPRTSRDDMELESGLASDFDGAIALVKFGVRDEYAAVVGNSDPMLLLSIDATEALGTYIEQAYSLGGAKQWRVEKGGSSIVSDKTPDSHRFNLACRAGQLVAKMIETVGAGDRTKGQEFFLKRDHYMTEAEFYAGLRFHWKRVPLPTVGGETRDVLLPEKFLGEVGAPALSISGSGATVVTAPAATAPAAIVTGYSEELIDKLVDLCSGKTEREVKLALIKDEVMKKQADLVNSVFNKGLLKELGQAGKLVLGPDGKYI